MWKYRFLWANSDFKVFFWNGDEKYFTDPFLEIDFMLFSSTYILAENILKSLEDKNFKFVYKLLEKTNRPYLLIASSNGRNLEFLIEIEKYLRDTFHKSYSHGRSLKDIISDIIMEELNL